MLAHESRDPEYLKRRLRLCLGNVKEEDFLLHLWRVNIAQWEMRQAFYQDPNPQLMPPPKSGTISLRVSHPLIYNPWEIETLANEVLTAPKREGGTIGIDDSRMLYISDQALTLVRLLEACEVYANNGYDDMRREVDGHASRQIAWQHGLGTKYQLYRFIYIYGRGECAEAFLERYGFSVQDFTRIVFALHAFFMEHAILAGSDVFSQLDVDSHALQTTLGRVASDVETLRRIAADRSGKTAVSHRSSVFRKFPCITFPGEGFRMISPLPQLIFRRMSSEMFYDIIDADEKVRYAYGRHFEEYCLEFARAALPGLDWHPEQEYGDKKRRSVTPDILCFEKGKGICVIECKATRMSHDAEEGQAFESRRGFGELVKAVMQLWNFFAQCRLGRFHFPGREEAAGIVLTLEPWILLREGRWEQVVRAAGREVSGRYSDVCEEDMRDVIFTPVELLELTMIHATEASFKELLVHANDERYRGWTLNDVLRCMPSCDREREGDHPFRGKVGELLPWFAELEAAWAKMDAEEGA